MFSGVFWVIFNSFSWFFDVLLIVCWTRLVRLYSKLVDCNLSQYSLSTSSSPTVQPQYSCGVMQVFAAHSSVHVQCRYHSQPYKCDDLIETPSFLLIKGKGECLMFNAIGAWVAASNSCITQIVLKRVIGATRFWALWHQPLWLYGCMAGSFTYQDTGKM